MFVLKTHSFLRETVHVCSWVTMKFECRELRDEWNADSIVLGVGLYKIPVLISFSAFQQGLFSPVV